MARIEDYALIGNCETGALVARDGSIDWLCVPRFDSPACFAALLGTPEHGPWQITPAAPAVRARRRYRPGTLVLETDYDTETGTVTLIDGMLIAGDAPAVVRIVERTPTIMPGASGSRPTRTRGASRPRWSNSSSPRGRSPMRASGRFAVRAGRSRTRR